jgi:hypothetical protein
MTVSVVAVQSWECSEWLHKVHYAKRDAPISHAFGLYGGTELRGIVTYGVPSSAPLRSGIAGAENADKVLELNRLCFVEHADNWPSMLVGRSLRMLPRPSIVVSYADTAMGHVGYIYQACNFIYTGLSAKRTDWKVRGLEHLHGQTIADKSPRGTDRAAFMRAEYGDDFYLSPRPRKHRYIFICANRRDRETLRSAIKYEAQPYPKGDVRRYEIGDAPQTQLRMFL